MKLCHHYNFEKNINIFSKLKREGNTQELPSPFGRVRTHDFFFFICSICFLFAAFRLFAVYIFYLQRSFLFAAYFFYLQRTFFYLQRFFFVCSVSFLFAACPMWAIVIHGSGAYHINRDNYPV